MNNVHTSVSWINALYRSFLWHLQGLQEELVGAYCQTCVPFFKTWKNTEVARFICRFVLGFSVLDSTAS